MLEKCPECGELLLPLGAWWEPCAWFCPACHKKIPLWMVERNERKIQNNL